MRSSDKFQIVALHMSHGVDVSRAFGSPPYVISDWFGSLNLFASVVLSLVVENGSGNVL